MHDWSADISALFSFQGLIGLLTLSLLEIILGIDNIIFISIAVNKLPVKQQKRARTIGLLLALIVRSILLFFVGWIASLRSALFHLGDYGVSGKALILFAGGIFLLIKTWQEIQEKIYTDEDEIEHTSAGKKSFNAVIMQIVVIDFVFSFDSILAAVGVSGVVLIMIGGVVVSMVLMMLFSGYVADFINKNQGIKMIALVFLLAIGAILVTDAILDAYNFSVPEAEHVELNKNYAYVAIAFALVIEMFNMKERRVKRRKDLGMND
ncbi:MAG: TerC family protein [Bacteroidetes bacterium]|nr:TerC family protein [Bacteroidota bacterium]